MAYFFLGHSVHTLRMIVTIRWISECYSHFTHTP